MGGIKQHIDDTVTAPLTRIETQTKLTNGRVSKLEMYKNYIAGGIAVLVFLGIPLLTYYINNLENLKDTLAKQVMAHNK